MAARVRVTVALAAAVLGLSTGAGAATLPQPVFSAVHGRVVGWARSGDDWLAVYVAGTGTGWCGLDGASWWVALVQTSPTGDRAGSTVRIGSSMCGNTLAWVRAGRFSDGRHPEVAFLLWATPSLGATTYLFRIEGSRLVRLATFPGDRVTIARGTVTATFENAGRSPNGELRDVYRYKDGRYRLTAGQ
jgi:hypothetical protein